MKLFTGLIGFVILLLAISFALANRQPAVISLWPFGVEIEAPLYILTLGTLFFGLLLGAFVAWLNLLPHRFQARRLRKDLAKLQGKIEDLQQTVLPPHRGDEHHEPADPDEDNEDLALLPRPKSAWGFGPRSR
ncbi:MAG: lipopolysaccharide assembly protein LapA domain-containing protein [Pseudomonadota bacterium]|nr:lipopolysaccharide assembly protein LapA domain-containing protein [Pseudomonadota bacterium]